MGIAGFVPCLRGFARHSDSLHSVCLLVLFAGCISASIFMGLFFLFY